MNDLQLFLKLCEACGTLWLRTGPLDGVYCRSCKAQLAQFPAPHAGKCRNKRRARCSGCPRDVRRTPKTTQALPLRQHDAGEAGGAQ